MSAAGNTYRDELDMEVSSQITFRREWSTLPHRSRRPEHRRSSAGPARVNGIHRRRNKRWTWGTGRSSLSLRAIASGLAVALATIAGAATAAPLVTIDFAKVGDPGNTALDTGTYGPRGAVSQVFNIAKYETTNSDYVSFLNAVDASGTNPFGIYNSQMSSNTINGGILRDLSASPGSRYSVRTGFESKPVNFVSWFSAARFANWLNNGQGSGTAATETGAYTLNGKVSGAIVARNSNALVFLPSLDQYVKAAFYNSTLSNYYSYGTSNNAVPTPAASGAGTNQAAFNGQGSPASTTGVVNGDSFPNTTSPYGLFNAFGNVAEWSDTANGSLANVNGSGWRTTVPNAPNWASDQVRFFDPTTTNDSYGFRVAAVPEPGSIVLAAAGLGGVFGGECLRRRRRKSRVA